jgi:rRNA maturation protein Nop10
MNMQGKKIALIALLIAVIAGFAVFAVIRVRHEAKMMPTMLVDQLVQKIDMKTLEVIGETNADWRDKYAPNAAHYYKNPNTGEYTMTDIMKCASCGQIIPKPQIAPEFLPKRAPGEPRPDPKSDTTLVDAMQKTLNAYLCPRCGKHAWVPPPQKSKSSQPGQPKSKSPQAG